MSPLAEFLGDGWSVSFWASFVGISEMDPFMILSITLPGAGFSSLEFRFCSMWIRFSQ